MELIKEAQKEWAKAKLNAQHKCMEQNDYGMAEKLSLCSMFKGSESMEEMIALMFSPKGAEFLTRYNFPPLATFRKFIPHHPEQFGVYIDAGKIEVSEPRKIFLVGNTTAIIKCEETASNRIVLMHGASATILASGYSVTKIEKDQSSDVSYVANDHARILV